jgi:hypothetical protein
MQINVAKHYKVNLLTMTTRTITFYSLTLILADKINN